MVTCNEWTRWHSSLSGLSARSIPITRWIRVFNTQLTFSSSIILLNVRTISISRVTQLAKLSSNYSADVFQFFKQISPHFHRRLWILPLSSLPTAREVTAKKYVRNTILRGWCDTSLMPWCDSWPLNEITHQHQHRTLYCQTCSSEHVWIRTQSPAYEYSLAFFTYRRDFEFMCRTKKRINCWERLAWATTIRRESFSLFPFFLISSGGRVKIKLKLPHFHVSDTCVSI